jgi:hypothetical protein
MRRKLRFIVGEFLIETGEMIRDIGGFILPNYEQHPAFRSNGEIDNGHVTSPKLAHRTITRPKL